MDKETLLKLVSAMGVDGSGKTNVELIDIIKEGAGELKIVSSDKLFEEDVLHDKQSSELFEQQRQAEEEIHRRKMEILKLESDTKITLAKIDAGKCSNNAGFKPLRLNKLSDNDDPLVFFEAAERLMATKHIPFDSYAAIIVESLTGKALQAYASMDKGQVSNYYAVKQAVLKRFNVSADSSRILFREASVEPDSSFADFGVKLNSLASAWVREAGAIDSFDKLFNMIVLEQFLNSLSEDIRVWLLDKKPTNVHEASEYADAYCQARKIAAVDVCADKIESAATVNVQAPMVESLPVPFSETLPAKTTHTMHKPVNTMHSQNISQNNIGMSRPNVAQPIRHGWRQNSGWRNANNFSQPRTYTPAIHFGPRTDKNFVPYRQTSNVNMFNNANKQDNSKNE